MYPQFSEFQRDGIHKLDTDTLSTVRALRTSQHLEFLHHQQHAWEISAAWPNSYRAQRERGTAATHSWQHMVPHSGNMACRAFGHPRLGTGCPGGRSHLRQPCALSWGQPLGLAQKPVGCSTLWSLQGSNRVTVGLDSPVYWEVIWRLSLISRKMF